MMSILRSWLPVSFGISSEVNVEENYADIHLTEKVKGIELDENNLDEDPSNEDKPDEDPSNEDEPDEDPSNEDELDEDPSNEDNLDEDNSDENKPEAKSKTYSGIMLELVSNERFTKIVHGKEAPQSVAGHVKRSKEYGKSLNAEPWVLHFITVSKFPKLESVEWVDTDDVNCVYIYHDDDFENSKMFVRLIGNHEESLKEFVVMGSNFPVYKEKKKGTKKKGKEQENKTKCKCNVGACKSCSCSKKKQFCGKDCSCSDNCKNQSKK